MERQRSSKPFYARSSRVGDIYIHVAHQEERLSPKEKVAGSSPVMDMIYFDNVPELVKGPAC